MEIKEFLNGVDFHDALEEALVAMENETPLGQPGNQEPVMIVLYSDGRVDAEGTRILDTRVIYDMESPAEAAEFIAQL